MKTSATVPLDFQLFSASIGRLNLTGSTTLKTRHVTVETLDLRRTTGHDLIESSNGTGIFFKSAQMAKIVVGESLTINRVIGQFGVPLNLPEGGLVLKSNEDIAKSPIAEALEGKIAFQDNLSILSDPAWAKTCECCKQVCANMSDVSRGLQLRALFTFVSAKWFEEEYDKSFCCNSLRFINDIRQQEILQWIQSLKALESLSAHEAQTHLEDVFSLFQSWETVGLTGLNDLHDVIDRVLTLQPEVKAFLVDKITLWAGGDLVLCSLAFALDQKFHNSLKVKLEACISSSTGATLDGAFYSLESLEALMSFTFNLLGPDRSTEADNMKEYFKDLIFEIKDKAGTNDLG